MKTIPPVIKWTGSKRTVANQLAEQFLPSDTYFEPFVGGGAMITKTVSCAWAAPRNNPTNRTKSSPFIQHSLFSVALLRLVAHKPDIVAVVLVDSCKF